MSDTTHNGTIMTNEMQSGYVWYHCGTYGLDDNTQGRIGYHVAYRPLGGDCEGITPEMISATREHYREIAIRRAVVKARAEAAVEYSAEDTIGERNRVCQECGTYCYGDCQAD